ncbi:hypothetical protein SEA_CAPTAINREX_58 [Microbacterium phage CaptainRex]|nr:hypothetical protein SEA_HASITHA_58 [Microbacterium phage Hasitha]UVK59215.1 hypothetical protein SEA_LIBRIE_58 [Microbacterium phage Librie]WIC89888.1 hypothetical protein SEA_CAPTAINREX_58 [Microbacterium phage CaptainRex]
MTESLGKAIESLQGVVASKLPQRHRKEIAAVLAELDRLRVESLNTVLREATREPAEGFRVANPGEFAAMWNLREEEGRQVIVDRINDAMDASIRCVQADHEHLEAQLEIARHVSTTDINRLAQYLYEEIGSAKEISLTMAMTGKPELVAVLEKALSRIGIRKVQAPDNWTVEYGHQDCAECEDCAEQAISYAKAAGTQSEQQVKSAFGGHFGSARRA